MNTAGTPRRTRPSAVSVAVVATVIIGAAASDAQELRRGVAAPVSADTLKVFLDCGECDPDYQRQHVTFVEYVRDRAVADLHVLVITQPTGSGGSHWDVRFIGLGKFEDVDRTFTFVTEQRASTDDRRREFARIFKIGLAGYAAAMPVGRQLDVTLQRPRRLAPAADRWGSWVFRIGGGGSVSGEQRTSARAYRASFTGNRVTPNWKVNLTAAGTTDRRQFSLTDRTVESRRDVWALSGQIVKTVGDHAGAGLRASLDRSSFSNIDRVRTVASGIEYDLFPYRDAGRRSLTVQYSIGTSTYDYRELTIYDKLTEIVPHHAVIVALGLRAPWGMLGANSSLSQHLNHRDRQRLSVAASTDVNLFSGFSLNLTAGYDAVNDLLSLRKGDASSEEILLRQRQLATDHTYSFTIGASYSFGSIFNTIVNPRFGGPGGLVIR